ncbi:GntR family transcriptional regulator [Nonomuraea sp. NPDC049714]|uniref:GntR family transcriptional regulator n=1 Tax=Nonomuraea sp. NPDC049714 TaxID=3364357 RepID=UPI0037B0BDDC
MSKAKDARIYVRIADDLRNRILQGDLPAGAMLPSEAALASTYGVARGTVRQAVAELERSGLVASEAGRGRRVKSEDPIAPRAATTQYESIAETLRARIENGELAPGQQLPGEAATAEEFGVSKGTARQALQLLAGERLITAIHGKGWFVGGPEHARTRADAVAAEFRQDISTGKLAPGSVLPGENTLAQERGVGRVTIRRAFALLETEGVIEKRPGMGRVVKSRAEGDT